MGHRTFAPLAKFEILSKSLKRVQVRCLLVVDSCLFIGLADGDIVEWSEGGELRRTFTAHSSIVLSLLHCGDTLWSASADKTMKLWNLLSAQCTITIQTEGVVSSLVQWKECIISGHYVTGSYQFLYVWSKDGCFIQ